MFRSNGISGAGEADDCTVNMVNPSLEEERVGNASMTELGALQTYCY
jgi:hypothetical protein